jgi:hypothetical protein
MLKTAIKLNLTPLDQPAIVGREALLNLVNWVKRCRNGSVAIESWEVGQCARGSSIPLDQADGQDGGSKKASSEAGEEV